jgi:hypothetical protein
MACSLLVIWLQERLRCELVPADDAFLVKGDKLISSALIFKLINRTSGAVLSALALLSAGLITTFSFGKTEKLARFDTAEN